MKAGPLLLTLLLLAPLLPAAEAAEPTARWHGPTGMMEGWHVRIPVKVENTLWHPVRDAVASYDLPLADFLVQAGWVTSRKGTATTLESWELDPDSVRVIEYRGVLGGSPLDGLVVGEVPSRVSLGLYESKRPYNNRTQPDLHVSWVVPGETATNATRTFFIQVDTLANGKKEPARYAERDLAPLEGHGWVSRGTTLYGRAASILYLIGIEDDTLARVDVYSGSKPFPLNSGGEGGIPNPVPLRRNQVQAIRVGTQEVIRIESNKPLIAYGAGDGQRGIVGPVPSTDGNLLGREFLVPDAAMAVVAVTPGTSAQVMAMNGFVQAQAALSVSSPAAVLTLVGQTASPMGVLTRIVSTDPVLLLGFPWQAKTQTPTVWGAPSGSRIIALPLTGDRCGTGTETGEQGGAPTDCMPSPHPPCTEGTVQTPRGGYGTALVTATTPDTWVRGRDTPTGAMVYPKESPTRVSPTALRVEPGRTHSTVFESIDATRRETAYACPVLFYAAKGERDDAYADTEKDLLVYAGGIGTSLGMPLGGADAKEFSVFWSSTLVAHHNGTQVTVEQKGATLSRTLGKGEAWDVDAGLNAHALVRANKPLAVLPKPLIVNNLPFGGGQGWFAGFDESLRVSPAATPQYRGYLVSLAPAGVSTEPMQGLAAPGKAATYKLLVKNLAKDERGVPVADVVDLALDPLPEGWSAELSATTLRLQGGGVQEVTLTVKPPDEANEGLKGRVTVSATSQGNPRMSDRVQAITTVRASYAVGIWFEREGAPAGRTFTLDPEETKDIRVVVKNLASVPDRVNVRAALGSPEWIARWGDSPSPVLDLSLDPGEVRNLNLRLTAPALKTGLTTLSVLASSVSDTSAGAKQDATARVRADVLIALDPVETVIEAAPGELARLQVVFENRGVDRVGIRFNTTGALPEGWPRPVVKQGEYEIDELTGIGPGARVPLDILLQVPANATRGDRANVHFFVETLPQFAGDPIQREAVDLLVLAGARHDLAPVDPTSTFSLGLADTLVAQLTLANGGNGDETLRIVPREIPDGATIFLDDAVLVPQGERGDLRLEVDFLPSTEAGTYRVAADVVAADGHVVPWAFNVSVPERSSLGLHPLGPLLGIAGVDERVRIEVSNEGNVPLLLPPKTVEPPGWDVEWTGGALGRRIEPGESAVLVLQVKAPRDATPRAYPLTVASTLAPALEWDLRTVVLSAETTRDGDGVAVRLHNAGTGDALGVNVTLLQDDVEVDRVFLQRIAAGGDSDAILAPRDGGGDLEVVVDNDAKYTPTPLTKVVGAAPLNPAPGATTLLVALAVVGAAILARRRR